ncbi:MAG TPA: protein phosphatase 2C domain-containing protein [Micropepsaceae bacterium]|nr:protein phosphatase 2C domain-containing protein [Micropepsaceae bacterium]
MNERGSAEKAGWSAGAVSEFAGQFAAGQMVGDRHEQEDDFAVLDLSHGQHERLLFVLADGMGGHAAAADVAHSAVTRFREFVKDAVGPLSLRLQPALAATNAAIAVSIVRDESRKGAGCTLLAAAIEDRTLSWISVGDSSLLLFRNKRLQRLNADHSMRPVLSRLVAAGRLSAGMASRDPRRHSLRSAVTGGEIPHICSAPEPFMLLPGDCVILASDGLETLSSRSIASILKRTAGMNSLAVVQHLLKATRAGGSRNQDNTTIIVHRVAR